MTHPPIERPQQSAPSDDLRKPHEMIVMLPRSGRVTLTGRRLYNALLQVAQQHMAMMEAMPPADFMFSAPLPSLLRATGSSGEDRTAAKRYLREMRGMEVDWESTAAGEGVKWRGFALLSEVSIEIRNGENWVSWSYPPTLMSALREPARWARLNLEILGRLGTYTALALYEICARYRDNPSGLTSRKAAAWWVDALSNVPATSERREWRKFKSERLREAIEEINRETELEVELIEHRQGRAVDEVQFAVRRKQTSASTVQRTPIDADLVRRAAGLMIREIKLDGLVQEFGEDRVRAGLSQAERRIRNPELRPVESAYAYLRTVLRNDQLETPVVDDSKAPTEPGFQAAEAGPTRTVSANAMPGQPDTSQHEAANAEMARLKAELQALDPVQRQAYVDLAIQRLADNGTLTPVIRRRADQGDPLHGYLGAMVVRVYAEARQTHRAADLQ